MKNLSKALILGLSLSSSAFASSMSKIHKKAYDSIGCGNGRQPHQKGESWNHYQDAINFLNEDGVENTKKLLAHAYIGLGNARHIDDYFFNAKELGMDLFNENIGPIIVIKSLIGLGDNKNQKNKLKHNSYYYLEALRILDRINDDNYKTHELIHLRNRVYLGLGNCRYTDVENEDPFYWYVKILSNKNSSDYHKQRARKGLENDSTLDEADILSLEKGLPNSYFMW